MWPRLCFRLPTRALLPYHDLRAQAAVRDFCTQLLRCGVRQASALGLPLVAADSDSVIVTAVDRLDAALFVAYLSSLTHRLLAFAFVLLATANQERSKERCRTAHHNKLMQGLGALEPRSTRDCLLLLRKLSRVWACLPHCVTARWAGHVSYSMYQLLHVPAPCRIDGLLWHSTRW